MKEILEKSGIFDQGLWYEDGRWIQPPFVWMFFVYWNSRDVVARITSNTELFTVFTIDGYAFHRNQTRTNFYQFLEKRYQEKSLGEIANVMDKEGQEIFGKLETELGHDDLYIIKNIDTILNLYKEFIGLWTLSTIMGDQIVSLYKKVNPNATDADLFAKVHPYLRATWIEEEAEFMKDIAQKYIDTVAESEISDLLDSYIEKFKWSRISKWVGEPVDKEYATKRLMEEVDNQKKGNNIKVHTEKLPADIDGIIAICSCSAYWRAHSTKLEMMMASRMRSILDMIGEKNGVDYKKILLLTPQEFSSILKTSDMLIHNKEAVFSREKSFFCTLALENQEIILTKIDPEYTEIENIYLKKHYEKTDRPTTLKGIGASKGHVTGMVRVIESSKQFDTFKEGEILVTVETSPTFVPLMRASAAILTGRGGITSHAAIVSRELGKPCIIAIKDIIRILKTGDMVEVDADKGVVTILK